jgi:Flp pilus assembly protein TadG
MFFPWFKNKFFNAAYWQDEKGMSFTETVILFPILLSMLMAVYDLGQGVVVNQKTVAASQVIADLITRNEQVTQEMITDIVNAGELALAPYSSEGFGYDIASVEFDEDNQPILLWRESDNMEIIGDKIDSTIGLGIEGEGVVMVSVKYGYIPFFSNFIIDSFDMVETAYLRGRTSLTIPCEDCTTGEEE